MDQRPGNVDRGLADGGLEHRLLELALDRLLLALAQARGDVLAQLGEAVEAGGLGGELVVELGQSLGLDLLDGHLELGAAAGELGGAVVIGEGDRDRALLAGAGAGQLLLEARDQPARSELEQLVATLAAGERLAVDPAEVVHDDVVAALGGALDGLQRGHALAQPLELGVDRAVLDHRLPAADLEALVLAELGLGPHADLDRELQRLALGGKLADVELRLADRRDPGAVDRLDVPGAERAAHDLVEHRLASEAADHDGRRDLALAEARDPQLAAEAACGLLDAALDLVRREPRPGPARATRRAR